jgi:hypothetical protein
MKLGGDCVEGLLKKKDFYAGLAMTLLGASVTLNSATYNLGTLMHMGPGMFPLVLGILLTFIGILIFISGLITPLNEGERILPESLGMSIGLRDRRRGTG